MAPKNKNNQVTHLFEGGGGGINNRGAVVDIRLIQKYVPIRGYIIKYLPFSHNPPPPYTHAHTIVVRYQKTTRIRKITCLEGGVGWGGGEVGEFTVDVTLMIGV